MRLEGDRFFVVSREENEHPYSDDDFYPAWAVLKDFRYYPNQRIGCGVEPHYHDCDEIWLFIDGRGEAWLDGIAYPIEPGTFVFTPRGVFHRFQMFSDFRNASLRTLQVGQRRPRHLIPEIDGLPQRSGKGMVVAQDLARTPVIDPEGRFPLHELRISDERVATGLATIDTSEYWMAIDERLALEVDGVAVGLHTGDLAILRAGSTRSLSAGAPGIYAFARAGIAGAGHSAPSAIAGALVDPADSNR